LVLGLTAISALGLAAPAIAADLAARPYTKAPPMVAAVYDWSGFYIGANAGWASSRKCWDLVGVPGNRFAASIAEGCHDASGGLAGGQVGYNWQMGSWVVGLEAQGDWADLKGSNNPVAFPGTVNRSHIDALGLFTGRLGYAWNATLLYVRGGAAVANDKYDFGLIGAPAVSFGSETRWGGTIGAGLEYGFTPNWSAAVDYQHAFLGRRDVTFSPSVLAPVGVVESIKQDVDMVTARINYRWGGPVVARY